MISEMIYLQSFPQVPQIVQIAQVPQVAPPSPVAEKPQNKPRPMQTYKVYGLGRISKKELETTLEDLGMSLAPRGLHLEGEDGRFNAFVNCPERMGTNTVKQRLKKLDVRHVKYVSHYKAPSENKKKGNVLLLIVVAREFDWDLTKLLTAVQGIQKFAMDHITERTGLQAKSVCAYSSTGTMCKFGIEMQNADDANDVLSAGIFDALPYNDTLMYSLQKTKKQIHYKTTNKAADKGKTDVLSLSAGDILPSTPKESPPSVIPADLEGTARLFAAELAGPSMPDLALQLEPTEQTESDLSLELLNLLTKADTVTSGVTAPKPVETEEELSNELLSLLKPATEPETTEVTPGTETPVAPEVLAQLAPEVSVGNPLLAQYPEGMMPMNDLNYGTGFPLNKNMLMQNMPMYAQNTQNVMFYSMLPSFSPMAYPPASASAAAPAAAAAAPMVYVPPFVPMRDGEEEEEEDFLTHIPTHTTMTSAW